MSIGENIKKLREATGMSQDELARAVGVGQNAISKIEAGTRFPSVITLRNIARVFNVTTDSLYE